MPRVTAAGSKLDRHRDYRKVLASSLSPVTGRSNAMACASLAVID
jgi:hypothetical protein